MAFLNPCRLHPRFDDFAARRPAARLDSVSAFQAGDVGLRDWQQRRRGLYEWR